MTQMALIEPPNRIAQLVPMGEDFDVSPPLKWEQVADEVTTQWTWQGNQAVPPDPEPAPIEDTIDPRLDDGIGQVSRNEMNDVKAYLRGE